MEVRHLPPDGPSTVLADQVSIAETTLQRARGLMFRRSLPAGHAMVFDLEPSDRHVVHNLFVPFPIRVIWLDETTVTTTARFRSWFDIGWGGGDRIIEVPAEVGQEVSPGDRVVLSE